MAVKNPKDVFVQLLSDIQQGTEIAAEFFTEISQLAQDPDIKEAMEVWVFISENILANLDQCFKLIGEKPVDLTGRLTEAIFEDFHKELAEIQHPVARRLFILAKMNHLVHLRIAEYATLIAAADITGHFGVGVLLEACLADKLAFAERTRCLIRNLVEANLAARLAS
jgi:ferritin-like metal-binding protein YciE